MKTEASTFNFSHEEINTNHETFLKRKALYKGYGIDHEELRGSIVQLIQPHSLSVLEIGTGNGYLTTLLAGSFNKVVTVDMESNCSRIAMLNAAYHNRLGNIEFITADAGNMSFPDKSFDAIVSAFTFHHFDLPFKALREMIRIAGRQIIISDFNDRGFETVEKIHLSEGRTHERKPADFSIVGVFLKEFDFEVTVVEEEYQTIYSAKRR